MFRSIRWTVQIWYALVLLGVVCIFGAALYFALRQARLRAADAELEGLAQVLSVRLRPPFGPPRRDGGPGPRPDGFGPFEPGRPHDGPIPPEMGDPARTDNFEKRFELPENLLYRFEGQNAPYFAIWRSNGQLLRASRPKIPAPQPRPAGSQPSVQFRQRGDLREVIVPAGPVAMQVLVGRSMNKELAELHQLLLLLGLIGAGVMAIGLAGGWLVSGRVVRPIRSMTATARSISAANLSGRIDASRAQDELGELAGVLNDMFSRLEAAFEQQVRFTADASHELRTPLSVIYTQSELALSRPRSADEYRQAIEACFRASRRMKGLIESLLTLARADAGKLQIKHESVDLAQTAQDCVEMLQPLASEKNVELKLELAPACVLGDAFRLSQVITNLLTNAINYNREQGSVLVRVAADAHHAILSVRDTGSGISPEDQKHLFERFYRVDKARSRALGGSGLGLAISRTIVEAHGGTMKITSTPGEGTWVDVTLPVDQNAGRLPRLAPPQQSPAHQEQPTQ